MIPSPLVESSSDSMSASSTRGFNARLGILLLAACLWPTEWYFCARRVRTDRYCPGLEDRTHILLLGRAGSYSRARASSLALRLTAQARPWRQNVAHWSLNGRARTDGLIFDWPILVRSRPIRRSVWIFHRKNRLIWGSLFLASWPREGERRRDRQLQSSLIRLHPHVK